MENSTERPLHPKSVMLTLLTGGGFTFETRCLLQAIRDEFGFVYLATEFGGTPGDDGIPPGDAHPIPSFSSVTQKSVRRSAHAFAKTFMKAFGLLWRRDIDLVVGIGGSHTVPMLLAARVFGKKAVFVESITRADRLSNSGKIVYHLRLAPIFIVQWPDLQRLYPRSRLGTVL